MSGGPPFYQTLYLILKRASAFSIGTMQHGTIGNGNLETDLDTNHIDVGKTYCDVVISDGLQKGPQTLAKDAAATAPSGNGVTKMTTGCGVGKPQLQQIFEELYDATDIMREQQEWESTAIKDNQLVTKDRRWMDLEETALVRSHMRTMQYLYYEVTGTISVLQVLQCTHEENSWYYQMAGIAITIL